MCVLPSQRERRSSLATSPMWTLFDLSNSVSWDCNEAESFKWNFWDMSQGHLEGMIKDFKWSAAEVAKSCPRDGIFNAAALGVKLSRMLFETGEGLVTAWGSVKNWEIPVFHGLGSRMLLVPALKKEQALIWRNLPHFSFLYSQRSCQDDTRRFSCHGLRSPPRDPREPGNGAMEMEETVLG